MGALAMDDYDRGYLAGVASALQTLRDSLTHQEAIEALEASQELITQVGGIY